MAFLFWSLVILLLIIAILTIKLQINIVDLKYKRTSTKQTYIEKAKTEKSLEFLIKIKIYIFNVIPILAFKVDKDRFDKFENRKMVQKMQSKLVEKFRIFRNELFQSAKKWDKTIVEDIINTAKEMQAEVNNVDIKIGVGFENVLTTTWTIPTLSTAIAFWFKRLELPPYENSFEIKPIYSSVDSGKVIEIFLKCFIGIKMNHIIKATWKAKKKKEQKHLQLT